jgi:AcrR family transcriptional regulator
MLKQASDGETPMTSEPKTSAVASGRRSQKHRTRMALVTAADEIVQSGKQPTVTDAAEAAGLSRATAYRYFPTKDLLLAEVAFFAAGGPAFTDEPVDQPVPERVARLVRRVVSWVYDHEQPLRTLLRLSLDPATGVHRPSHRNVWIETALSPVRDQLDHETYGRLSKSLSLLMDIDPVVVMTDIADASRAEALDALEWSARTLVTAALHEAGRYSIRQ